MTHDKIRASLVSALTQLDERNSKRPGYNRNALAIYFRRVDDIMADLEAGADLRKAICAGFTGRTADVCLRAVGLPKSTRDDEPHGWHYQPVAR